MDDGDYEKWVHNIYLKHYKVPVSNSDWNNKIQSLPKNYQLKFKDNLWDLSGSFFENSLYWSKLWVANPQVENPHLIYKGNLIQFDPKILARVNFSKHSVDIQSQFPGLIVPENEFSRGALSESEIPSSLPDLLEFYPVDHEIDVSQLKNIDVKRETIVPFYLNDSSLNIAGEVISKNGYGNSMSLGGEELIVKIDSHVSIGSIFTVVENKGRIGGFFGFLTLSEDEIVIKGKIRIESYINDADSLYIASVVESLQQIFSGDSLLEGDPAVYHFSQQGPMGSGSGLIIGTPDKNQIILSIGSIVYLDKGEANGIRKGEVFYIQKEAERSNVFKRPYKYDQAFLGKLRIIHTAKDKSTGVIIESKDQIYVNDRFTSILREIKDLSQSRDHEVIEESETQQEGKELLIDFEENIEEENKNIEQGEEIDLTPDNLEDYEEIEEPEDEAEMEDLEETEDEDEAEREDEMEDLEEIEGEAEMEDLEEIEGEAEMEDLEEAEGEAEMEDLEETEGEDEVEDLEEIEGEDEAEDLEEIEGEAEMEDLEEIEGEAEMEDLEEAEGEDEVEDLEEIEDE